ncbi:MAG: MFS transporter [Actinomycetota bacterium]
MYRVICWTPRRYFWRTKTLRIWNFLCFVSAFLCAFAQNYGQLLAFRTAGGIGSSMFTVSAGSIIMRSVPDDLRGRAQSVYNGSFLFGAIAGPAIGGILSAITLRAATACLLFLSRCRRNYWIFLS